ncbi:hypothetical protein [Virgisporangium aurantiacum]|uniref:Peroxiredoxin n=1 Tax=Virgisporangium aurantiacum TaxID=175570 RepID=A0A8J3ZGE6_9ACTN|nr:hypothetical protein [Virgisporangium aurantiacum]GIJ61130.1 peroxiredoxin [Virgisporangium aurantiacum]
MGIDIAGLRGDAKGLVVYFIRAANCAICVRHVKALAGLGLAARGVAVAVVVPGGAAEAERVRRVARGVPVVSSDGVAAHRAAGLDRTLIVQHSGTLLFDATGQEVYRLAATLPTGSFDATALDRAVSRL